MLTNYLALDVGRARIGVALANNVARIASPVTAVMNNEHVWESLAKLVAENQVKLVIVGWPRGLNGQETEQTQYVATFVENLQRELDVEVKLQDEAVTSVQAEAELQQRGKNYEKGDIDSLSAVYILDDFLQEGVH